MPRKPERIRVEIGTGPSTAPEIEEPAGPVRVLVVGPFAGSGGGRLARPIAVNRDSFDEVLARVAPELRIPHPAASGELALRFRSLEDFHPDLLRHHCERAAPAGSLLDAIASGSELSGPTLEASVRAILHQPALQALEAAWNGLLFLLRRVEPLYVLDATREGLGAALRGLSGQWDLIVADFLYGDAESDRLELEEAAAAAKGLGARLVTGAAVPMAGRGGAVLAYPRFLLRLPYGEGGATVDSFDFEECPGAPEAGHLLWGNPGFAIAAVLAGGEGVEGRSLDITDGPAYVYRREGEPALLAATEHVLSPADAEEWLARGLSVLLWYRSRATVRAVAADFSSLD